MIRDAETESLIRTYAKPILTAAGLGGQGIDIHIVNDRAFNAFVIDGHNMFIHAGALMDAKTPNQIIGVIAHESGHITGGHLARLRSQMSRAKSAALMLQLLGLAAMAAGAAVGAGNLGQLGMGAAFGGTDAAMRMVLAYRQDEESSADQAAITAAAAASKYLLRIVASLCLWLGRRLASRRQARPTKPRVQRLAGCRARGTPHVGLRSTVTDQPYSQGYCRRAVRARVSQ